MTKLLTVSALVNLRITHADGCTATPVVHVERGVNNCIELTPRCQCHWVEILAVELPTMRTV